MDSLRRSRREEQQRIREFGIGGGGAEAVHCFTAGDDKIDRGADFRHTKGRITREQNTEQCIALIDYDALDDDEISFRAGDVINVTGKGTASGFWEGYVVISAPPVLATSELSDAEHSSSLLHSSTASLSSLHPQQRSTCGLFPNCLVTSNMRFRYSLSHYALQNVALCLYAYQATGDGEMSFVAGDIITAVRPSSSPGWWYGVKSNGPTWVAPSAEKASSSPVAASARFADPAAAINSSASRAEGKAQTTINEAPQGNARARGVHGKDEERLFPTNFVTCDVVQVNFNFTGRQPHELSCKVGDIIQMHRRWNDGWWEGTLRGHRGIFPSNYTIPNIATTAPPLFCARCRTIFPSNVFYSTCAMCAAEQRVEDAMMQAMEAYVRGETTELDLFAGVDISLHTSAEGASDGDTGLDGALRQSSREASRGDSRNLTRGSSTSSPSTCSDRGTSCPRQRQRQRGGRVSSQTRVSLLTEKDMADLASNRVKLME